MRDTHGIILDPWKCPRCSEAYVSRVRLVSHMVAKHGHNSLADLANVGYSGNNSNDDQFIKSSTSGTANKEHGVDNQHTSFESSVHKVNVSNGWKTNWFSCRWCSFKSRNRTVLQKHMLSAHSDVQPFECKLCGVRMKLQWSMRRHLFNAHGSAAGNEYFHHTLPRGQENVGNSKSKTDKGREMGRADISVSATWLKCSVCVFKTRVPNVLSRHMKAVHACMPYKCKLCGRRSNLKSNMKKHLLRVHGSDAIQEFIKLSAKYAAATVDEYMKHFPPPQRKNR